MLVRTSTKQGFWFRMFLRTRTKQGFQFKMHVRTSTKQGFSFRKFVRTSTLVFSSPELDKKHRNADINTKRYKVKNIFLITKQFIIIKSDLFSVNRTKKA